VPHIGMFKGLEIKHPKLILGSRNKIKIMHNNPKRDLSIGTLNKILQMARELLICYYNIFF